MVRDRLKDREFFKNKIPMLQKLNQETLEELKNNEIKKERISDVSRTLFTFALRSIFCSYSAGDSKEEVRKHFDEALRMLDKKESAWEHEMGGKNHMGPYHLRDMVALLSLAVLLDATKEQVALLVKHINYDSMRHRILDYLLSYFTKNTPIDKLSADEYAFKDLTSLMDVSNEEILSKKLMDKYLKNWFKVEDRVVMYDRHKYDNYVGYWSFESAAFVKIRGLDDSGFRDNVYYPKDLI